ncbi:hypothetical protein HDU98_010484 [Podochytrium sp. JEL0797]|nr:hypothetical protein HDU98_010484 [Podochytrium sp. JEL0797]
MSEFSNPQDPQKIQSASAHARDRANIGDVNKKWDEMMKSTTPVPGVASVPGSATNGMGSTAPSSATVGAGTEKRGLASGSSSAVQFDEPGLKSGSAPISDMLEPTSTQKTKKSISFSENVMYRSLSSIDMGPEAMDLQHQASLMAISELWSDEDEDYRDEENDTLYSEEGLNWSTNHDEFEAMVDGTNIMTLPLDDEDDNLRIPLPIGQISGDQRHRTSPPNPPLEPTNVIPIAPPNPISRATFNASPIHKFLKNQTVSPPPPSMRFESPSPPLRKSPNPISPIASSSASRSPIAHLKEDNPVLSHIPPQAIINNQLINLEIPLDIHEFEDVRTTQLPPTLSARASSTASKPSSSDTAPAVTKFAGTPPISFHKHASSASSIGLSPILLRTSSTNASANGFNRTLFKSVNDSDATWEDVISNAANAPYSGGPAGNHANGSTSASSSHWIKRATPLDSPCLKKEFPVAASKVDFNTSCAQLKSLHDEVTPTPSVNAEDAEKTMRKGKETMSTDSLVLEEEDIVLEVTKASGGVASAAFFIPIENAKEKKGEESQRIFV